MPANKVTDIAHLYQVTELPVYKGLAPLESPAKMKQEQPETFQEQEDEDETTENVCERGKQLWQEMKLFGASKPGVAPRMQHFPSWIDKERVQKAQKVLSTNLFGLDFSALGGLLFGLHDPEHMLPLLVTGKSCNIPNLFLRYLSTIHHARQWYTEDILEPSSPGFRSLMEVRCRHLAAYEKVNSHLKQIPGSNKQQVWMSQYVMVKAQFAFIGFIILYPEKCGLVSNVNEFLQELCYLWRVIGFILGIEDEYNLGSRPLSETIEMCKVKRDQMVEEINSSGIDGQTAGEMARDIIKSLNSVLLFRIPGDVYLRYWCRALGLRSDIWPEKKNFIIATLYYFVSNIAQIPWSFPRKLIDKVIAHRLKSSIKRKDKIFKRLYKKYPQVKFSLSKCESNCCPMQGVI